ncbi:relaxase/mobilization nuclease domain-containing protein [Sinorhizobium medicae]|uniref:relaxase/mobilization nuclease domain-containing protein n=1 Tax=Sinorhizobium medicae TaxID=110321 RepID=UPI001AAF8789|nr:relaxase/mobilization nuclease domain-containing protein [Sinorhizobium medicae]MBO1963871.1 relaxase [Sinorhizobium medicae]
MILKASQRGNGQNLAVHLMRLDDNEHMQLYELRGFVSDDLRGAFKEAEAIARGTKCRQYLFSLSLNPPAGETVSEDTFIQTIDRIEARLGLEDQPRAIVFHEKEGRRHAHCAWSRIDPETMTARQMSFFKTKLSGVSRELYLEHGWKMPRGLEDAGWRDPANFTLAEWQQAKRQGLDPRWLKLDVQQCWKLSDGRAAFARSLEERGMFLARGDKRGFVIVDHAGEVYSLSRCLDLKTRDVRARLGDGNDLKGVDETQRAIGARMTPAIRAHIAESRTRFAKDSAKLGHRKMEMTHAHRKERATLLQSQEQEWQRETRERQGRLPKGLRGLWHRITGRYQQVRAANEAEALQTKLRHASERQIALDRQRGEREGLQRAFKELRTRQAAQLLELRKDVGRYLNLARGRTERAARSQDIGLGLRLER